MFVKYIILDGFKSYAKETMIGPFDQHFNAITGLNGTGKSNILDSICFVLGISSLSTVRAHRLEDLISKAKIKGRETIKTAKASIVLDNTDKTPGRCPIGYEACKEIIVSRTIEQRDDRKEIESKYHLNGAITQKNVVADLFESVRLDVNNPNFMIMQGKITKVVNMKPKELLQMIEDTVGATLYQHKREKTVAALENSRRQLESAESIMRDTVQSAFEAQKVAVKEVEEFRKLEADLHSIERKYAVAQYLYLKERYQKCAIDLEHLQTADASDAAMIEHERELIKQLKIRRHDLKKEADQHVNISAVEKEMSGLSRKFASEEAKLQAVKTNRDEAKQKVQRAIKERDEESKKIEDNKIQQQALIQEFENCNASITYSNTKIEELSGKLDKIMYGSVIDESGQAVNIQERLSSVEEEIRVLKGPNDIKKIELASEKKAITEKERTLRNTPSDEQVEADYRRAEAEVRKHSQSLRESNINPAELTELENSVHQAQQKLSSIDREYERAYHQYPYLRFSYQDPCRDFNRSSVHGLVYELFTVGDMDRFKVALEVAAGGYFTQVVVDVPETSKLLISRGNLRFRTTFLPLSALQTRHHLPKQAELDRKLGKDKAFSAIDLVQYDSQYRTLMETVFGSAVICIDMSVAKAVAYQMKYRAVTLEGDVVDPGGTMQGGTRRNAGSLLSTCQTLVELKQEKQVLLRVIQDGQQKIELCRRNSKMIQAHDGAARRLQHAKEVLALTAHATLLAELKDLRNAYVVKEQEVKNADVQIAQLQKEEKSLRDKLKRENQIREKNKREVEAELKRCKRELQFAEKLKKSKESLYKDIEIDLKAKDALLNSYDKDIEEAKANEVECIEALKRKQAEFSKIREDHLEKMQEFESSIEARRQHEKDVDKVGDEIAVCEKKIDKIELARLKRGNNMKTMTDKVEGYRRSKEQFIEQYPDMDFRDDMQPLSSRSAHALKSELDKRKASKEDKQARLNFKAAEALPRTSRDITEYGQMRLKMERMKDCLAAVLTRLDAQKSYLVQNAYKKVNTEFDFMMNTLLPQSHAKLVPVNPNNIADGVVIHVCLAGVWKESLTELSGGQRSLVALSLVLSLCLYNPAPFYILDEIDSALDVNHTSNIGYLIRTKFPQVQFICVSLKDGMYNNANVIFRTYFEDGTSKVKATVKKAKQHSSQNTSNTK